MAKNLCDREGEEQQTTVRVGEFPSICLGPKEKKAQVTPLAEATAAAMSFCPQRQPSSWKRYRPRNASRRSERRTSLSRHFCTEDAASAAVPAVDTALGAGGDGCRRCRPAPSQPGERSAPLVYASLASPPCEVPPLRGRGWE